MSCIGTVAFAEAEPNSSAVEFDLNSGILDSITDLLETDFNPSWNTSLDELQEKYEGKDLDQDDTSFSVKVEINGSSYYCVCFYDVEDMNGNAIPTSPF